MAYLNKLDPFLEAVRTGKYAGKTCYDYSAVGKNADVDAAAAEDLWYAGTFTPPTTARIHDIVSTSANDDGAPSGTGARTIQVYGVTVNGLENESILMNGTTNVATANAYYDIYDMVVITAGVLATNDGVVTATAQTDGTITCGIAIGDGNAALRAIRYVPNGYTGYLFDWNAAMYQNTTGYTAEVCLKTKYAGGVWVEKAEHTLVALGTSSERDEFKIPLVIAGENWVKIEVAVVSNNNTLVQGGFNLLIVAD